MRNVQISFDEDLLKAVDNYAASAKLTRSAIVRDSLKHWLREKEIKAFEDIKQLSPIHNKKRDIIPYEGFTEIIEVQLRMKVRMGFQIIPTASINHKVENERIKHVEKISA